MEIFHELISMNISSLQYQCMYELQIGQLISDGKIFMDIVRTLLQNQQ